MGALEQGGCELGLGGEHGLLGDVGQFAVFLIGRAAFGQVQGPIEDGVPARGGVGEMDRDLA
nr:MULTISPECIES: hypothetical protein [unclassified Nonomuraea]